MDKIQTELDAMKLVSYTNDTSEDMQNILVEQITNADHGMVDCNSNWCDKIITEDGSYYEYDLREFAEYLGLIDEDLPEDEQLDDLEITGLKYTDVVAHVHDVEDIEYNQETKEIKPLGTFQTEYTLYCSKSCAVSSRRTFLIMKANHEKKKG
tara:strand:- start:1095 stop:1553 length:459 start_codon:yes stop_codon:yes gene_type:complete